jgi:hypothetical protein
MLARSRREAAAVQQQAALHERDTRRRAAVLLRQQCWARARDLCSDDGEAQAGEVEDWKCQGHNNAPAVAAVPAKLNT